MTTKEQTKCCLSGKSSLSTLPHPSNIDFVDCCHGTAGSQVQDE
jgi:hypothetical protein